MMKILNTKKDLYRSVKSFTLVELLIVIAILAVLAAAVVIVLNPAELLAQARDSQRITDLKTTKDAVDLFILDNPSSSLGTAQRVYISIPDTNTNCSGITGLPTLPTGWQYVCVTAANLRNTNGTGWIPLDFGSIKGGSPMPYLPIDPTNDAVSGRYYTYTMGGSYELTALFEAQKSFAMKDGGPFVEMYEIGSNVSLLPVSRDSSLVGYWTFDGTGSITNGQTTYLTDFSGKGNNGTASNANGTGMSFAAGKFGNAVSLDGVDDSITYASSSSLNISETTFSAWVKVNSLNAGYQNYLVLKGSNPEGGDGFYIRIWDQGTGVQWLFGNGGSSYVQTTTANYLTMGAWYHIVGVAKAGEKARLYLNGQLWSGGTSNAINLGNNSTLYLGKTSSFKCFNGLIDDVRIYNRALSDSEVKSLYEATK